MPTPIEPGRTAGALRGVSVPVPPGVLRVFSVGLETLPQPRGPLPTGPAVEGALGLGWALSVFTCCPHLGLRQHLPKRGEAWGALGSPSPWGHSCPEHLGHSLGSSRRLLLTPLLCFGRCLDCEAGAGARW